MKLDRNILARINSIQNDSSHGSSELARQAAEIFIRDARRTRLRKLENYLLHRKEIGRRLIEARPAMASIYNVVDAILNTLPEKASGATARQARDITIEKATEIMDYSLEARRQIAHYTLETIQDGDRLFTHSYSSTVVASIVNAFHHRQNITVVVSTGGPGNSGIKTARQLAEEGMSVTLIDDSAIGLYIESTSKALVGCDRILNDGRVINATGTGLLAMAARFADIPFYVLCEKLKFDPRPSKGELDLEPRPAYQLVRKAKLPSGIKVRNYTFDTTPPELIKHFITDTGLMTVAGVVSFMSGRSSNRKSDIPG
jgi:eIF-2B alpha/beta/delta-like uncharacterized protein